MKEREKTKKTGAATPRRHVIQSENFRSRKREHAAVNATLARSERGERARWLTTRCATGAAAN